MGCRIVTKLIEEARLAGINFWCIGFMYLIWYYTFIKKKKKNREWENTKNAENYEDKIIAKFKIKIKYDYKNW